jgi:broad specificity phosphatase PhoE
MRQTDIEPQLDVGWNKYDHQDILAQFNFELATAQGVKTYASRQNNPHKALKQVSGQTFSRWISNDYNEDYLESWPDYQIRIQKALANLINNLDEQKHVAVFSSGDTIALLSQAILGVPAKKFNGTKLDLSKLWCH